jgi:hypothetical protein
MCAHASPDLPDRAGARMAVQMQHFAAPPPGETLLSWVGDDMTDLELLKAALEDPRGDEDWAAIGGRWGQDPLGQLGSLKAIVDPRDPWAAGPAPGTVERLERAAELLGRLGGADLASVTEQDRDDLLLLAQVVGRPALPIRGGELTQPPPQWGFLRRERIEPKLGSVGRIDAPAGAQLGTGFVVKAGVVMTNRHVAEALVAHGGGSFPTDAVIDFDRQEGGGSRAARLVAAIWISDEPMIDLALLRAEGDALPAPLHIQREPPGTLEKRLVYAIGYPGRDNLGKTPPSLLAAVFGDAYGVKRVQPGLIRGLDTTDSRRFRHDCSTLGGSSGSCIVDYATGLVCGLHYSGIYKVRNSAVALWTVAGHEKIAPHIA